MTHDELLNMTHDELLKAITLFEMQEYGYAYSVILAVVELHKPQQLYGFRTNFRNKLFCEHCDVSYPCPTIQAIEKELS